MTDAPPPVDDQIDENVQRELDELAKYGEEDRSKPDPARDFGVPVALLGVGGLLVLGQISYMVSTGQSFAGEAIVAMLIEIVVNVVVMLIGVLIAAKFTGANYGPVGPALMKLCALFIGPTSLGAIITVLLGGDMAVGMIGWAFSVICYWSLISYFFRLDGANTIATACAIGVARFVTSVFIVGSSFAAAIASSDEVDDLPGDEQVTSVEFEATIHELEE